MNENDGFAFILEWTENIFCGAVRKRRHRNNHVIPDRVFPRHNPKLPVIAALWISPGVVRGRKTSDTFSEWIFLFQISPGQCSISISALDTSYRFYFDLFALTVLTPMLPKLLSTEMFLNLICIEDFCPILNPKYSPTCINWTPTIKRTAVQVHFVPPHLL